MKKIDLSQYRAEGATEAAIEDFSNFSEEDKERMLFAGIDVDNPSQSGAFMHLNHSGVHCKAQQEGLEVMDIKEALEKFDGLPDYYWQLVDKDKDEFTKAADENLHGGYFIRAKAGAKITEPVQSCQIGRAHV